MEWDGWFVMEWDGMGRNIDRHGVRWRETYRSSWSGIERNIEEVVVMKRNIVRHGVEGRRAHCGWECELPSSHIGA